MSRLIMAQHNASGDVLVLDIERGLCSDPLHYEDRDAPLDWYHLDEELGAYDPTEWEIIKESGQWTIT